ncbi:hypothetical protein [Halomonas nitroreducens]|uniref:Uncharacterized protein n=1 Tax=Halomonas nitroreducens TaxID=447425 RepID=A0A3S0HTP6_9GAMM|nr:hypothetical protein EKG36_06665 [Halomonas nitroreducens]
MFRRSLGGEPGLIQGVELHARHRDHRQREAPGQPGEVLIVVERHPLTFPLGQRQVAAGAQCAGGALVACAAWPSYAGWLWR